MSLAFLRFFESLTAAIAVGLLLLPRLIAEDSARFKRAIALFACLRASLAANPDIEGLRAMFDVAVKPGETADLRAYLRAGSRSLTETWTFPWTAPAASAAQIREESPHMQKAAMQEAFDMHAAASIHQPTRN